MTSLFSWDNGWFILQPAGKSQRKMFDEEEKKPKKTAGFQNLEFMSVAEIEYYIQTLKAEIQRAEADIARKKASAAAADSFFKS